MSKERVEPEVRRVQLTGGATLIVSLPKEWARKMGIRQGDEVYVIPQPDMSLLVFPKKLSKAIPLEMNFTVTRDMPEDYVYRLLFTYYMAGYETIRITFDVESSQLRRKIKEFLRKKFIGVEVVEESSAHMVLRSLMGIAEVNIIEILLNMSKVSHHMLNDLRRAVEAVDVELARDIAERDDEMDRFYWLAARQLKRALVSRYAMNVMGIEDPRDAAELLMVSRSFERIGDHIAKVAYGVVEIPNVVKSNREVLLHLIDKGIVTIDGITKYIESIETVEPREIFSALSGIESWSREERKSSRAPLEVRALVDSLIRVVEYSADILESLMSIRVVRGSVG